MAALCKGLSGGFTGLLMAAQVLAHWHQTDHRALLFTQTQQMLDIAESAVQARHHPSACTKSRSVYAVCAQCPIKLLCPEEEVCRSCAWPREPSA